MTDATPQIASIRVLPAQAAVVPGGSITLRADVRDVNGRRLPNPDVRWTMVGSAAGIVSLRPVGVVEGTELGGPATIRGSVEDRRDSAQVYVVTSGSAVIDELLTGIDEFVNTMLQHNVELIPLNPRLAEQLRQKIALLERPELSSEIVRGRYTEGAAVSGTRRVPIGVVFVEDTMRPRVDVAVRELERALPVLETFIGSPLVSSRISVRYGFRLGSSGGGGSLYVEDQGTYEARRTDNVLLPYLAIVDHELAHSFIGHESLTQFLELYLYNTTRNGSHDVDHWSHTRGYVPERDDNTGVHAILDIYRIIGHDAMSEVFNALHALRPPYGELLSRDAREAIIERAPPELQAMVAAKVDRIGL